MIKDIQSLSLLDILPDNLLADEKVTVAAKALDKELQAVTAVTIETLHLPRLDVLPEKVLDLLAWQWHVDFYEPIGTDIETKRKLIRESIAWHRIKGSPAAVEEIITKAFNNTYIKEWFEYNGEPYHFKLITENGIHDLQTLRDLIQAINTAKNVRSWLEKIEYRLTGKYNLFCSQHSYDREIISQEDKEINNSDFSLFVGLSSSLTKLVEVHGGEFNTNINTKQFSYAVGGQYDMEVLNAGNK